jgi:hypothetical protein
VHGVGVEQSLTRADTVVLDTAAPKRPFVLHLPATTLGSVFTKDRPQGSSSPVMGENRNSWRRSSSARRRSREMARPDNTLHATPNHRIRRLALCAQADDGKTVSQLARSCRAVALRWPERQLDVALVDRIGGSQHVRQETKQGSALRIGDQFCHDDLMGAVRCAHRSLIGATRA